MSDPFDASPRRRPSIQLSALIDVVFILMIFVILGASFDRMRSLQIAVPKSQEGESASPGVLVEVAADGNVRLEGKAIQSPSELTAGLEALREERDSVLLRADRDVPLQRAMDVFDAARSAGFRAVDMVTRPRTPSP